MNRRICSTLAALALVTCALAQNRVTQVAPSDTKAPSVTGPAAPTATSAPPALTPPADYVLGGGDLLQVDVPDLGDEFTTDKTFRIDGSGDLGLPIVGHVQAAGLTVMQLEQQVKDRLKNVLKFPDVTFTVTAFGSQPVSVLGAVNTPGMVQIAGRKNLFEVLSLAGGLAENAGYQVTITRDSKWGPIPLANAHPDNTGQFSVASVKIKDLLDSSNTTENILILPDDKISVPPSDLVYAVGNVNKPGGFLLNEHESLSALQVVSLAEGFNKTAAPQRAKILRVVPGSPSRLEIQVDLNQLTAGKIPDFQLQSQDILFVPNSKAKSVAFHTLDALTAASGALIYTAGK